jgi:hypothetical protein
LRREHRDVLVEAEAIGLDLAHLIGFRAASEHVLAAIEAVVTAIEAGMTANEHVLAAIETVVTAIEADTTAHEAVVTANEHVLIVHEAVASAHVAVWRASMAVLTAMKAVETSLRNDTMSVMSVKTAGEPVARCPQAMGLGLKHVIHHRTLHIAPPVHEGQCSMAFQSVRLPSSLAMPARALSPEYPRCHRLHRQSATAAAATGTATSIRVRSFRCASKLAGSVFIVFLLSTYKVPERGKI